MAEQDRKDLVPSVLNDLIDVDGTPADGQGLRRSAGVWTPADMLGVDDVLPEFGPCLSFYEGSHSGTIADASAAAAAWSGMDMGVVPGYGPDEYPGGHVAQGTWSGETLGSYQVWHADEPGIYQVYTLAQLGLDGAPHATGEARFGPPWGTIPAWSWGTDTEKKPFALLNYAHRVDTLTVFVSQGMIDAGKGGFAIRRPYYITPGSERANSLYLFALIERVYPGATFDYYADL